MTLDYINLDDAMSAICKARCGEHHTPRDCWYVCEIVAALNALPVEALRPVIRCRECKWSSWYDSADGNQYCYCMETGAGGRTANDYCSYAEREDCAEHG